MCGSLCRGVVLRAAIEVYRKCRWGSKCNYLALAVQQDLAHTAKLIYNNSVTVLLVKLLSEPQLFLFLSPISEWP